MPAISIAVPVYNGGALLREALGNLQAQTFDDFEATIFDNASTDDTGVIAREFAARDPRFTYVRQERNVGALHNFMDALAAARAPLFLWRAVDDHADPAYLATLVALLRDTPDAGLAVGRIETRDVEGRVLRAVDAPMLRGDGGAADRLALLFRSHPSWIYGLFRREPLARRVAIVRQRYGHPWAWDHLTLLPLLLDGAVVGSNDARFVQSLRRPAKAADGRKPRPDVATMRRLRQSFLAVARDDVEARFTGAARLVWRGVIALYVGKRVYRWRRVLWRLAAERAGPARKTSAQAGFEKYF